MQQETIRTKLKQILARNADRPEHTVDDIINLNLDYMEQVLEFARTNFQPSAGSRCGMDNKWFDIIDGKIIYVTSKEVIRLCRYE